MDDQHSGRTRVTPYFEWLQVNGGDHWVNELLRLADGIKVDEDAGRVLSMWVGEERTVEPSAERLAWMIRNAHRLCPADGRRWREYQKRVIDSPKKHAALAKLDSGISSGVPKELRLEGSTHADCLIESERAFIWIEGKRNDWLSPSTTWDISRDQLARNVEAVWLLAKQAGKDFWLLLCHEHDLRHHEDHLLAGYRAGTWKAGLPHVPEDIRLLLGRKIGTVRWSQIRNHWKQIDGLDGR